MNNSGRHFPALRYLLPGALLLLAWVPARSQRFDPGVFEDPRLLWVGHYALLRARAAEVESIRQRHKIPRAEIREVRGANGEVLYRIPARFRDELVADEQRLVEDPPYRAIDPDIEERRRSEELSVWMRGYKDEIISEKILRRLARDFPDETRLLEIGRSGEGRPIFALKIGAQPDQQKDRPAILFNGAHHGTELLSIDYVLDLAYYLLTGRDAYQPEVSVFDFWYEAKSSAGVAHYRRPRLRRVLENFEIWLVPVVNPDGVHTAWNRNYWSGRKNTRDTTAPFGRWNKEDGVDLNRNYPFYWRAGLGSSSSPGHIFYRGPEAASEPETRAMMNLAERERFAVALSFHCYATKVLVPYTIESAVSPDPNAAWRAGEELARVARSHRTDRTYMAQRNIYAVDGTDQDWLFHEFGTLAYIVEGSHLSPPHEPSGRLSVQGMRPLSLEVFELFERGPVLEVHTVDSFGNPIEAEIRIIDYKYYENERFRTHPVTGRYDYFLYRGGSFVVLAERAGADPVNALVNCESGVCPVRLELTVPPSSVSVEP